MDALPDKADGEGAISVNVEDGRDRALLRRAIKERWPIPDATRDSLAAKLATVIETGDHREVVSAARVLIAADALNQADDHLADKNERLDAGKPTENVQAGVAFIVPGLPK